MSPHATASQVGKNPHNTVFDAKRLIGRKVTEPAIREDMKHWPFKVRVWGKVWGEDMRKVLGFGIWRKLQGFRLGLGVKMKGH